MRQDKTGPAGWGLVRLFQRQPGLRVWPAVGHQARISGTIVFDAHAAGCETIHDTYDVELTVPLAFPRLLPTVIELGGRISKRFHTNPDRTLCLGSETRLKLLVAQEPTLPGFVERILIPFLYSHSFYERYGRLPFGELSHGSPGLLQDFADLFGVSETAALAMVRLATLKKRHANKSPCPCGSGYRVGKCHNTILNGMRSQLGRHWFRRQLRQLSR